MKSPCEGYLWCRGYIIKLNLRWETTSTDKPHLILLDHSGYSNTVTKLRELTVIQIDDCI